MIEAELPDMAVKIGKDPGFCSCYAERGGLWFKIDTHRIDTCQRGKKYEIQKKLLP